MVLAEAVWYWCGIINVLNIVYDDDSFSDDDDSFSDDDDSFSNVNTRKLSCYSFNTINNYLHITFCCIDLSIKWLRCHPFDWYSTLEPYNDKQSIKLESLYKYYIKKDVSMVIVIYFLIFEIKYQYLHTL